MPRASQALKGDPTDVKNEVLIRVRVDRDRCQGHMRPD